MKTIEIKCDACDGDLTDAGPMPSYRIELSPAVIKNSGSIIYSVIAYPSIDRCYHFCDLRCLDHWRGRENFRSKLWKKKEEEWKESQRNGRVGQITSWISMPSEVHKAASDVIEAATMAAFPMERPDRHLRRGAT